MHRTFNIYPERRLCVVRFIGAIDYEDFVQWADDAMKEPLFSRDYDGVVDIRRAVFKHMRPEKARELATFMIDHEFTNGKWVSLVTKPMESALSLVYSEMAKLQHPHILCSTVTGSGEFLGQDLTGLLDPDPL
jgi:hypothetical protein